MADQQNLHPELKLASVNKKKKVVKIKRASRKQHQIKRILQQQIHVGI